MSNLVKNANEEINYLIAKSFKSAFEQGKLNESEIADYVIEIPSDTSHGDFATNVAMVNAKNFHTAPRKIAEALLEYFDYSNCKFIKSAEIAGPGFINFSVTDKWFTQTLMDVKNLDSSYGKTTYGQNEKVMIEFVSANPTGPMHMGNARGGAIGDVLACAMCECGYNVTKEFYINDAGNQIAKFGKSLEARYLQSFDGGENIEFPEDGYHGEDITERAVQYKEKFGDKLLNMETEQRQKELIDFALPINIAKLKSDLEKYRITYDVWFHESTLHNNGLISKIIKMLDEKGLIYKKDGATWYKATEFGGEKDEVVVRANGFPTYFAADIAYHYNKFIIRGFDKVINVWGADHHGHVARLKGAMTALDVEGDRLDIILMQLVRLLKDGQPYKMSKRTGKAISLSDLTAEIPIDAARFFFNMREPNSTLDFDLDLAVEQSSQNPVYYVQYAYARICSIVKKLKEEGIVQKDVSEDELNLLTQPEEKELIRKIATYPQDIIYSAKNYDPAKLTHYSVELATLFHKFYNACRVNCEDKSLLQARLALCTCTRTVVKNVLKLLKIDAPEHM